jgi:hypothetical protein
LFLKSDAAVVDDTPQVEGFTFSRKVKILMHYLVKGPELGSAALCYLTKKDDHSHIILSFYDFKYKTIKDT